MGVVVVVVVVVAGVVGLAAESPDYSYVVCWIVCQSQWGQPGSSSS